MTHKLVSPKTSAKHLHGSSSECSVRFKSGAFLESQHFPPGCWASAVSHSQPSEGLCAWTPPLLTEWPGKKEWELFPFCFTEKVNVFLAKTTPNLLRNPPRSRHGDKSRWEAVRANLARNRKPQTTPEQGVHIHIYIYLYIRMYITEGLFSLSVSFWTRSAVGVFFVLLAPKE